MQLQNKLFLSLTLILLSCTPAIAQNEYPFKCGDALTFEEVRPLKMSLFSDYTEGDIKMVEDITAHVAKQYDKTIPYEVFINQKTDTSLVLDIYGLEKEEEVDETSCWIFNGKEIDLPARTTLLFHRYINDYQDGGIVVGLTWKK